MAFKFFGNSMTEEEMYERQLFSDFVDLAKQRLVKTLSGIETAIPASQMNMILSVMKSQGFNGNAEQSINSVVNGVNGLFAALADAFNFASENIVSRETIEASLDGGADGISDSRGLTA